MDALALESEPLSGGPLPAWRARVAAGLFQPDPAQQAAAERLQNLWTALRGYNPIRSPHSGHTQPGGLIGRLLRRRPVEGEGDQSPHGLYLVGEVGRGKSMLMDLFFGSAQVARKRRTHFHAFMQDVHARIHAWRQTHPAGADPIPPLADAIAAGAALLCFDEFQITDVADAMILGRLFQALFARGVVVVATSNTLPSRLFEGQPGRDAFLPFIAMLQDSLDVLVLEGERDWRRVRLRGKRTWHVPADAAATRALDAAFAELSGGAAAKPRRLMVSGRFLQIPLAAGSVARFGFAALCQAPLGPGDYLAIATHFHALVLDGVPLLGGEQRDATRRFIVLIDALYDHRVKLVASADAEPDALCRDGDWAPAFQRTASRLIEMQDEAWVALPHLT
jgi:cell division protein ZapE